MWLVLKRRDAHESYYNEECDNGRVQSGDDTHLSKNIHSHLLENEMCPRASTEFKKQNQKYDKDENNDDHHRNDTIGSHSKKINWKRFSPCTHLLPMLLKIRTFLSMNELASSNYRHWWMLISLNYCGICMLYLFALMTQSLKSFHANLFSFQSNSVTLRQTFAPIMQSTGSS